ncbi:type V secretion system putative substrate protein [Paraburkholderia sp. BL23I1N1]|uniref:ESPR-type extended signal peptide-containing protein n=1 Tax=Paraburkholderia sp. BL23I1N1 TaxID=1938802 RepID=UPI000FF345E2|nr:type V secretion system putative substrate protein [Paraburkholderia sp. BL23I1N1]
MNHVYRLVWSQPLNDWVAVAEFSRGRGKGGGRKRVFVALTAAVLAHPAVADPSWVTITGGTGGTDYTFDSNSPPDLTVSPAAAWRQAAKP